MMKKIAILLFALSLSACTSFANPFTANSLSAINESWGATLALGANYRDACANRLIPPACRPIVVKLQSAAIPVQAAVKAANAASIGGSANVSSFIATAGQAIDNYKALQTQYGVK